MSSSGQNKKLLAPGRSYGTNDSNRSKNAHVSKPRGSIMASRNQPFASTRSNVVTSASKRQGPGGAGSEKGAPLRAPVQIIDDSGKDVTPMPLLNSDPSLMKKNQPVLGDSSIGTPTDLMSQASASIYGTQGVGGTATTSVFGGGPFTRSVFTQSYDTGDSIPPDETGSPDMTTFAEVRHKRQEVQEVPTADELVKIVDITLTETDTIWMFDMPDVKVSKETTEAGTVADRNKAYAELQKSRVGNDLYAERGMNTFNEPPKMKSVSTIRIDTAAVGSECTNWDMYDTYEALEKEKKAAEAGETEEGTISRPASPGSEPAAPEADTAPATTGEGTSATNVDGSRAGSATVTGRESRNTMMSSVLGSEVQSTLETTVELSDKERLTQEWNDLSKSESLRDHLFLIERVINLNTYQTKQALYRGFVPLVEAKAASTVSVQDMGPNLDRLWSYNCNLTKNKNVSCIAWNKSNPDLVAVGYGHFEFTNQKPGIVCCWCIKNPEYPERVFTSKHGVTALDFSTANANLLAVGYYDGGIAVYNVRKSLDEPVLDNFTTAGKHLAPVWQLRWIEKERGSGEERAEVLISISSDGRVTQWSIRKGFESYDVMKLKKMPTRMAGRAREKKGEAFISRYAGGMSFDFHSGDSNIYLAGTEEGFVHKCSCSHNEQYLESYSGHTGPVYSIQWSPFVPDIFLSCSADWTIKLWKEDKTKPILSFHSCTKSVNDVCWSPWSSTVFACVNEGAVEVWDLAQSTLDAVYTLTPTSGARQTSVSFSKNSQCLLVGDSEGQVTVYELRCMPHAQEDQQKALNDVIKSSLASQLPGPTDGAGDQEDMDDPDL